MMTGGKQTHSSGAVAYEKSGKERNVKNKIEKPALLDSLLRCGYESDH